MSVEGKINEEIINKGFKTNEKNAQINRMVKVE